MIFGSIPDPDIDLMWFLYVPLIITGIVAVVFLLIDLIESVVKRGRPSPLLAMGVGAAIGAFLSVFSIIVVAGVQDVELDKAKEASLVEIGFSDVDLIGGNEFSAAGPDGQYVAGNLIWDRDTARYLVVLTKGFTDE